MKINPAKLNLLISGNKTEQGWARIGEHKISETRIVKL